MMPSLCKIEEAEYAKKMPFASLRMFICSSFTAATSHLD